MEEHSAHNDGGYLESSFTYISKITFENLTNPSLLGDREAIISGTKPSSTSFGRRKGNPKYRKGTRLISILPRIQAFERHDRNSDITYNWRDRNFYICRFQKSSGPQLVCNHNHYIWSSIIVNSYTE